MADDRWYRQPQVTGLQAIALRNVQGLIVDTDSYISFTDNPWEEFPRVVYTADFVKAAQNAIKLAQDYKSEIQRNERNLYEEKVLTRNLAELRKAMREAKATHLQWEKERGISRTSSYLR